jgi:glucose/mannose transport system substrate-binding protein
MRHVFKAGLLAATVALCAWPASADEIKVDVVHSWTSGGEAAGAKVIADQVTKAGGTWVETAIAGFDSARAAGINRIVGGNPPTALQASAGSQLDGLIQQGLLNNVDDLAKAGEWDKILPKTVIDAISRDGHYYAVPISIHGQNWMFNSNAAFAKAGISEPPADWASFLADLDKLKDAGLIPLALGGQAWQEHQLFNMVLLSVGGKDMFDNIYLGDASMVGSPEFAKVVDTFGKLRAYTDAGSPGRSWNDTTALLITDKAGVQFMGDWAKGEFTAASQTAGKEYGCNIGIGPGPFMIISDVFVFPKTTDPAQLKAQALLAKVVFEGQTQIEFSKKKGSIPVRTDVDAGAVDACAAKANAVLASPSSEVVMASETLASPELQGALDDVIADFWSTPSETTPEMVEKFAAAIEAAK